MFSMQTSSGEVSPSITPSTTPLGTHAPKYGTVIPNRIFVGGIAANVSTPEVIANTEQELKAFFSAYGAVKDSKIIADRAGVSKGYGFVTFETQEDAEKIIKKEADNLIFKDRKLNIGPAIRKQPFPRLYGDPSISPGTVMFTNGVPYTYQNGMAFFHPSEGGYPVAAQPQVGAEPAYSMMAVQTAAGQQALYMPQPSYYQTPIAQSPKSAAPSQWTAAAAAAAQSQWRWAPQVAAGHTNAPQYIYPMAGMQGLPEMYSAAQAPQAYQQAELDGMMEAAPAEWLHRGLALQ